MDYPARSKDNARHIQELEAAAQETRLRAMRLAAMILTKMDEALATTTVEVANAQEIAVLQVQHASEMKRAEDLQTKIDKLRADEYDRAYRF